MLKAGITFGGMKRSEGVVPEADILFARMTSPPTAQRRSAIKACIANLKSAGIWAKLDCLQVYAAHDSQAALLDWVNASRTATSTATFVTDRGFVTGTNAVVDLGFGPSSAGNLMSQNSQTFGFFSDTTETTNTGSVAGSWDGARGTTLAIRAPDGTGNFRVNVGTATSLGTSNFTPNGLWTAVRETSARHRLIQNGGERWGTNVASTGVSTTNFFVGGLSAAGGATKRFNLAYGGLGLSNTEISQFNLIIRAYMSVVGVT